jgi:low affinity Fe/Cu permease
VLAYGSLWVLLDRESLDWHGAATLATPASRGRLWLMTLFIQRAEHRDTQAIQAKLDELLRSQPRASDELAHIDRKEPEEIEAQRGI